MNPENIKSSIQAVIDGLTPLADKLSIPLEKIFEYAMRQNYVYAIESIFGLIGLLVVILIWLKIFEYGIGKEEV
jgi:hypothetical protein